MFEVGWRGNNLRMSYKKNHSTIKCSPEATLRRIDGYSQLINSLDGHVVDRPELTHFGDDDLLKVTRMFSAEQQPYLAAALGNFITSMNTSNLKVVENGSHYWDQKIGRLVTPVTTLSKLRTCWVKNHQERHQTAPKISDLILLEEQMSSKRWNLFEALKSFCGIGKPEQERTVTDQIEEEPSELSNMPDPRERFKCHAERNWENSAHLKEATIWFGEDEEAEPFQERVQERPQIQEVSQEVNEDVREDLKEEVRQKVRHDVRPDVKEEVSQGVRQ